MYTLGELADELNRQEWAVERMLKNRGYLKNNGDPRKSTIDNGLMNKNGLIKETGWSVFIDELGYKDTDEDEEDEIEDVDIDDDDDEDIEDDEDDDVDDEDESDDEESDIDEDDYDEDEDNDENIQGRRLYDCRRYPGDFESNQFGYIFFGSSWTKTWHVIGDDYELEGSPTENKDELFDGLFEYKVLDSDFNDNDYWVIISNSDEPNHFSFGDVCDIETDYKWFTHKDDILESWIESFKNGNSIRDDISDNFNSWFEDNREKYKPFELENFQIERILDTIENDVIERSSPKTNKKSSSVYKPNSVKMQCPHCWNYVNFKSNGQCPECLMFIDE